MVKGVRDGGVGKYIEEERGRDANDGGSEAMINGILMTAGHGVFQ